MFEVGGNTCNKRFSTCNALQVEEKCCPYYWVFKVTWCFTPQLGLVYFTTLDPMLPCQWPMRLARCLSPLNSKLSPVGRGYSWMGDHLGIASC